jgi:hypothetical protein
LGAAWCFLAKIAIREELVVFAPKEVHEGRRELGGVVGLFFEGESFGVFDEEDSSFVAF